MMADRKLWAGELDQLRRALRAFTQAAAGAGTPEERVSAVGSALAAIEDESASMLELRLQAIGQLRDSGYSYEQIASVTGLSKARVAQLSRLSRRSRDC